MYQVSRVPSGSITVMRADPLCTYPNSAVTGCQCGSRIASSRIRREDIDRSLSAGQYWVRAVFTVAEPGIVTGGVMASTPNFVRASDDPRDGRQACHTARV